MNIRGITNFLPGKYLAAPIAVLLFTYPALGDEKPKPPAKAASKYCSDNQTRRQRGCDGETLRSGDEIHHSCSDHGKRPIHRR